MTTSSINVMENLTKAVSILNNLDEYLEGLVSELSECDSIVSDYQHLIENTPIEQLDLKELYLEMQSNFQERRRIKNDMTLRDNYKNLSSKLCNSGNREIMLQQMKNAYSKLNMPYKNRVLNDDNIQELMAKPKKVGRPKKVEVN